VNDAGLTAELVEASARGDERRDRAAAVAAAIRRFGKYRWVGVYDVGAAEIAVVGWDGPAPPTHPRFPRRQGLCGAAVSAGATIVVGEVAADPRYLSTHSTTRSEIVVPVFRGRDVVGLLDVESERPDAFDDSDRTLLERCAALIAPLWRTGDDVEARLLGATLPALTMQSTAGPVDLAGLADDLLVLFVYPHATGLPEPPVPGWEEIPGALGCTAQSWAFRDHHATLRDLGAALAGLSVQTPDEQREFAARVGLTYPLLSDPERRLSAQLGFPTFEAGGRTFYRRLTVIARRRRIVNVFYPITKPERNAAEVVTWLECWGDPSK
jgi:putative methionine-R-sulfoxide reductase with GAF domain/peroxiredoxin